MEFQPPTKSVWEFTQVSFDLWYKISKTVNYLKRKKTNFLNITYFDWFQI